MEIALQRIQKLTDMLKETPEDVFLIYALGMEELGLQHTERAIMFFRQVLERDPAHIAAHYQLGNIFSNTGQTAEAINLFEKGFSLAREKKDLKTMNEFRSALDELL